MIITYICKYNFNMSNNMRTSRLLHYLLSALFICVFLSCQDHENETGFDADRLMLQKKEIADSLSNNEVQTSDNKDSAGHSQVSLYGTWHLVNYGTDEAKTSISETEDQSRFCFTFYPDGTMIGYTSVNEWRCQYKVNGNEFLFTLFGGTKVCEEDKESQFISEWLSKVSRYELDEAGDLLLYYSDTERFQFVFVANFDK